jgi:hypothetical protein
VLSIGRLDGASKLLPDRARAGDGNALAYDRARRRTVLFGGVRNISSHRSLLLDDTWEWDGTEWKEIHAMPAPSPRSSPAGAFDGKRVLVFGGTGEPAALLSDTWAWDGSAWSKLGDDQSPR